MSNVNGIHYEISEPMTDRQESRSTSPRNFLAFLFFPLVFFFLFYGFLYIEERAEIGAFAPVFVVLFVVYFLACAVYAILSVFYAARRRARDAVAALAGAVFLITTLINGRPIADLASTAIDKLRLYVSHAYYSELVEEAARQGPGPHLVLVNWGAGGFLSTNFFYALVHDESAQIALSEKERTPGWRDSASRQYPIMFYERCKSHAKHLKDQFYSLSTVCQ